jgi:hypothetical protein
VIFLSPKLNSFPSHLAEDPGASASWSSAIFHSRCFPGRERSRHSGVVYGPGPAPQVAAWCGLCDRSVCSITSSARTSSIGGTVREARLTQGAISRLIVRRKAGMPDDINSKAAWRGFHMMISHKRAVRSRFQNGGLKGSLAYVRFIPCADSSPYRRTRNRREGAFCNQPGAGAVKPSALAKTHERPDTHDIC